MPLVYPSMTNRASLDQLRRRVAKVPTEPGVYRWLNDAGDVLYVGKAKNLRNRMRQYVSATAAKGLGPWKLSLLEQLADFDVTVTNTELEALLLETNLIKELRPKYNVLMKDDKNYVYLRVSVRDRYPRVAIVRRIADDHAKYFGPFTGAFDLRRTLDLLQEIVRYRACAASLDALNRSDSASSPLLAAPCLDYQIGQCCGLCAGMIDAEEYGARIDRVLRFFRGDRQPTIDAAETLMHAMAAAKKFEKAARLRDLLQTLTQAQEKQSVTDTSLSDSDIVGIALLSGKAQVMVLQKRGGKVLNEQHFSLQGRAEEAADVLEQFIPQYYAATADIPAMLVIGADFPGRASLGAWLSLRKGTTVEVRIPQRGSAAQLLRLAEKNAQEKAKQAEAAWEAERRNTETALEELMTMLDLPEPPKRIEGYDISHLGGTETVGSMVVCSDGKPKNEHYRSFTIRSMQQGAVDDYRALQEVLERRVRHLVGGVSFEEKKWNEGGVIFGKERKAEHGRIVEIIERYPEELSQSDLDGAPFLVARQEEDIVGFVRLRVHDGKLQELSNLWIDERFRGQKLGQFLARKLLASVKKDKVYVRVFPELEPYYAALGFRHVLKSPTVFRKRWEAYAAEHPEARERVVLVYDTAQHKSDASLAVRPDLLVIDGGKGQLNAVRAVLRKYELTIPVIGLAKREEEVFVPGRSEPIIFRQDSPAKFLLMRLRDEAHRFANRHRGKRIAKHSVRSALDRVPGIGPDTRSELIRRFGSADGVRQANDDALKEVLNAEQVKAVREYL